MKKIVCTIVIISVTVFSMFTMTVPAAESMLSVIASSSKTSYSQSYTSVKSHDSNAGTAWISAYTAPENSNDEYLEFEVGISSVTKVVLTPRSDGIGYPLIFKFQASRDGKNYCDIPGAYYDVTGQPLNSIRTDQTYTFQQAVQTRYVRLYVIKKGVDGWDVVQLVEMKVYGTTLSTWSDYTLFSDSFSSTLGSWTTQGTGTWGIESGELSQSDTSGDNRQIVVNGTFNQEKIRVESTFNFITDAGSAEIMFRRAVGLNHNSIKLDAANNKISIWLNGRNFTNEYAISASTVYNVKVELNGSNIKFYINDVVLMERDDNPIPETGNLIGLNVSSAHVHFDNFTITEISSWDRQWSTIISSSKIEKKGADRLNYSHYQYPYIGLAGTTMFAGPNGFTVPAPPSMDLTLNTVKHNPLILYDYWWDKTERISPFSLQGGYGTTTGGSIIEDGTINGENFKQTLDVGTGVLTTDLNVTANSLTFDTQRTQFINPQGVLVYKITDTNSTGYFKFKIGRTDTSRYSISYAATTNGMTATISYGSPVQYAYLSVQCSGVIQNTDLTNGILTCTKGSSLAPLYFYISPSSSLNETNAATAAYTRALAASTSGYTANLSSTSAWWNDYYMKSSIDIPDLGSAKWYVRSLYYTAVAIAGSRVPPGCYSTNPAGFFGTVCPEFDLVFSHMALLYTNHSATSQNITDWLEEILPKAEEIATNPYYGYPAGSAKYATLMGYDGTPVQDPSLEKSWVSDFAGANVALMEITQALFTNTDLAKSKEILQKVTKAILHHQQYFSSIDGYAHSGIWSPTQENMDNYLAGSSTDTFGAIWAIKMCQKYGVSTPEWDALLPRIFMPWTQNAQLGAQTIFNGVFSNPDWVGAVDLLPMYWLQILEDNDPRLKSNFASVMTRENYDYFFNRGWVSIAASKLNLSNYSNKLLRTMLKSDSLSDDTNFLEANSPAPWNSEDYKRSLELGAHGAFIMGIDQMLLNSDSDTTIKIFPSIPDEWESLGASFWQLKATGGITVSASYSLQGTTASVYNTNLTSSAVRDVYIRVPAGTTSAIDTNGATVQGIVEGNFAKVTVNLTPNQTQIINIVPSNTGSGLTAFTPEFPQNNSIGITYTNPIFSWQLSNTASSYTLVISPNADLSAPVFSSNVGNVQFYQASLGLSTGTKYYWKVTAHCGIANLDNSGGVYSFITAGRSESDYFSGNWTNPKWTVTGNCTVLFDKLNINIPASSNDVSNRILTTPGLSDFTLMAKLDFKPTSDYLQAGLIIYQDDANYIKLAREYNNGNRYEFSGPGVTGGTLVNDSIKGETAYLKMIKSGDSYTAFRSSDGYNWLQIGGVATITLTSPQIGVFGSSWAGSTALAKFDWLYFNETCSSVTVAAPPVSFDYYNVSQDKKITNISPSMLISSFVQENKVTIRSDVTLVYKSGATLLNLGSPAATGVTVDVYVGGLVVDSYKMLIYGDVDGDGTISISDMSAMKLHILKSTLLTGEKLLAADISAEGKVSISDLLAVKKSLLGIATINQNR